MRIGACFATFAILSYTKIIDNNWYLRHLFSYFLLGIQWGVAVIAKPVEKVTLPLTSTMLIGIAGDGGNGNNSVGFNTSLYIYTTAAAYPVGVSFIAICK